MMKSPNHCYKKPQPLKKKQAESSPAVSSSDLKGLNPPELEENVTSENFTALQQFFGDHLHQISFPMGSKYPRTASLVYLEGTTDPDLVAEYSRRFKSLGTEWVANIDHLARLIGDRSFWLFPEFQTIVCPENAVSALYNGKILLLLADETKLLIAPAHFLSFFQKPGDASEGWFSPGILLRLMAFGAALFLPAFYIAMVSFQYYAIPVKLFLILAEFRMKVPFPPVIEILLLEVLIETIREGSHKLATPLAKLIGAIGGSLVAVGFAASSLASPMASVFCSAALLASLAFPIRDLLYPMRLIMLGSIIITALFGVLGLVITASLVVAYLVGLPTADWDYLQTGNGLKRS